MIVLDTNVVSELMRERPEPIVLRWVDGLEWRTVWITGVSVFEIRTGIDTLPIGQRRARLDVRFTRAIDELFPGRVLHLDRAAADVAGRIAATRERRGFNDDPRDTLIAGIAMAHEAAVATRNVRHFAGLGPPVVDPWGADA